MRKRSSTCFPEPSERAQVTQTRSSKDNTQCSPFWEPSPPRGWLLSTPLHPSQRESTGYFPKGLPTSTQSSPKTGWRRERSRVEVFGEALRLYNATWEQGSVRPAHPMRHSDDTGECSTHVPGNLEKPSPGKRAPSLL